MRDRRAGLRAARLDADARLHRPRPPMGTQTGPAADLHLRRTARPRRPPPAAPPRRDAGPGPPASPLRTTACKPSRPADQPQPPQRPKKENTRARGTPPTRRDSRATRHGPALKTATSRYLRPAQHDHERSRLGRRRQNWNICVQARRRDGSSVSREYSAGRLRNYLRRPGRSGDAGLLGKGSSASASCGT